mgnify:FL=1|jgi:hypothetical protein
MTLNTLALLAGPFSSVPRVVGLVLVALAISAVVWGLGTVGLTPI